MIASVWQPTNDPQNKKQPIIDQLLYLNGRGERIRTSDLTVPNRALYQAEPRPDEDG